MAIDNSAASSRLRARNVRVVLAVDTAQAYCRIAANADFGDTFLWVNRGRAPGFGMTVGVVL